MLGRGSGKGKGRRRNRDAKEDGTTPSGLKTVKTKTAQSSATGGGFPEVFGDGCLGDGVRNEYTIDEESKTEERADLVENCLDFRMSCGDFGDGQKMGENDPQNVTKKESFDPAEERNKFFNKLGSCDIKEENFTAKKIAMESPPCGKEVFSREVYLDDPSEDPDGKMMPTSRIAAGDENQTDLMPGEEKKNDQTG
eukprot:Trichotokara_eunicae@DN10469_c0_g1_i1.p1